MRGCGDDSEGVCAAGDRVFDPRGGTLRTLELRAVPQPRVSPDAAAAEAPSTPSEEAPVPRGATLVASETAIASSSPAAVRVQIRLPPGYHLTKGANSRFEASALGPGAQGAAVRTPTPTFLGSCSPFVILFIRCSQEALLQSASAVRSGHGQQSTTLKDFQQACMIQIFEEILPWVQESLSSPLQAR